MTPGTDGDGVGDSCDCDPQNSTIGSFPTEMSGDLGVSLDAVFWQSASLSRAGAGARHDLIRGDLSSLPVGGGTMLCLASQTESFSAQDAELPAPGTGFWYLVRARNTCGTGTYGYASGGVERIATSCQ